jgi:hypothetical protein
MADNLDGPNATILLQVVYWHQDKEVPLEEQPRKYIYKDNLTPDEATEVSDRLNLSLNSPF